MDSEPNSWKVRMKGESQKLFERFKIYRDLPPEKRSLEEVQKKLKMDKNGQYTGNYNEIPLSTLQSNSAKWCWVERAELYDYYKNLEEVQKNEEDFKEVSNNSKEIFKNILKFGDDLLQDIMNSDYAISTKIKTLSDLTYLLAKSHEQFRLACGHSTTNNDVQHTGKVTHEVHQQTPAQKNREKKRGIKLKDLLTINEDVELFTDKL